MAENKVERRIKWVNIACLSLMTALAIILAVRLSIFTDCPSCFFEVSLFNKILLWVLVILIIGYIASIPVMVYKVRQSKKVDDDCDEGSCSY